ncbi:MAG: ABC transporter permease [candidate division Zixibacteria bacterium]
MFKNYLKVAVRNIKNNKLFNMINILGLVIGLGVCLIIIGIVNNELGFEDCHLNKDQIYRVDGRYLYRGSRISMASIVPAVGPAIRESIPEIERLARIRREWDITFEFTNDKTHLAPKVFVAEPDYLNIFTLPLDDGNPENALIAPFSVIISQDIAATYFDNQSPLGKTVKLVKENDAVDLQVTGVFAKIPANTQMRCDFVISYSTLEKIGEDVSSWTELFKDYTYVLLNMDADPALVESKIPEVIAQQIGEDQAKSFDLQLQPLEDIYFNSDLSYELPPQGNLMLVNIFSGVAAIIMIIACINFLNISSARISFRLKEVGIRKVLGALRGQLFKQFLIESMFVTVISMMGGLIIFELIRPHIESFMGRTLEINMYQDPILLSSVFAMILLVGLLFGSYPAFLFSRFQPVTILKNSFSNQSSKSGFRRIMVVTQFVLAVIMIFCTIGVYKQIQFSLNSDLGFDKDNILLIDIEDNLSLDKCKVLKDEILNNDLALSATIVDMVPGENRHFLYGVRPENKADEDPAIIHGIQIDADYLKTFNIEILEGREFSSETTPGSILINETAVKEFEIKNPIGFKFLRSESEFTVIGVVKDFHQFSVHTPIASTAFIPISHEQRLLAVKLESDNIARTTEEIKTIWGGIAPDISFDYQFLDESMHENYETEEKTGKLFTAFTLLAVFVSCLGLFGLASFTAERRTKEIGIRKVLGASITSITGLITKEFFLLVAISNVIAWPIAYYAMNRWLENFAYRIDIGWTVFALSGIAALLIALLTVGFQAIKAATNNPVDAIKYE